MNPKDKEQEQDNIILEAKQEEEWFQEECKRGLHYLCKHGNHSLEECKCISDEEYKEQEETEMNL